MFENELSEFLTLPGTSNVIEEADSFKWNHNDTLAFLELYKEYRKQVGSLRVKNLKIMFQLIARKLSNITGKHITFSNCENRWKHLERQYKKYVDNINKTGRGRKDFEYSKEMDDIFEKKKNVNPILVLGTNTVDPLINIPKPQITSVTETDESEPLTMNQTSLTKEKKTKIVDQRRRQNKVNTLQEIRIDRQNYYSQRLDIEKRKLEEKVKKNELLKEKNNLLQQYLKENVNPFFSD